LEAGGCVEGEVALGFCWRLLLLKVLVKERIKLEVEDIPIANALKFSER
jgi:hypothetical protein